MNQIIQNLYVGNMHDGAKMVGEMAVLCVMWAGEDGIPDGCKHIETTDYRNSKLGVCAIPDSMDQAAQWIHDQLSEGERVLVHCAYGIERSPLTVVWYLMRYKDVNFKQAYDLVMARRPEAQYRGGWMPESVKLTGMLPERLVTT